MINHLRKENKDRLNKLNLPNLTHKIKVMVMEKDIPYDLGFLGIKEVVKTGSYAMHPSWTAQVIKIINPDAEIYASKIDFPNVVDFCIENNIKIINTSFNCFYTKERKDALDKFYNWGGIFVSASGNNANRSIQFPASDEHTIAVGGTNTETSVGENLDVYAESHYYVRNKEEKMFAGYNGTSCSTPVIAGCVSLILAKYPNWNCEDVRKFLKDNSKQFDKYAGMFSFPDKFELMSEKIKHHEELISMLKDGQNSKEVTDKYGDKYTLVRHKDGKIRVYNKHMQEVVIRR